MVALRLSRRDALRHRTSSVLTAALVAAPVTALVLAGSLYASVNLSSATQDRRDFGNAAFSYSPATAADGTALKSSLATSLPAGSQQVTRHLGSLRVTGPGGHRYFVQTDDLPYKDPLLAGMVTPLSGSPRFRLQRDGADPHACPSVAGQGRRHGHGGWRTTAHRGRPGSQSERFDSGDARTGSRLTARRPVHLVLRRTPCRHRPVHLRGPATEARQP